MTVTESDSLKCDFYELCERASLELDEYVEYLTECDRTILSSYAIGVLNEREPSTTCAVSNDAAFVKMLNFSANLRKWRRRRGLSVSELACSAGVSERTVAIAEILSTCSVLVKTVSLVDVIRLCSALNVSLNNIIK